jgi:hypothetical protein
MEQNMAASGQINCYDVSLDNDPKTSAVHDILFHTNRCIPSKNYIILYLHKNLRASDGMERISKYIQGHFKDIKTKLLTTKINSYDDEVKNHLAKADEDVPAQIEVPEHRCARVAIDILFKNKEMTDEDRRKISVPLKELEKSADYAERRKNDISLAQKELLQSMVLPYISEIEKVTKDFETIKKWIEFVAKTWCDHAPEFIQLLFEYDFYGTLGTKNQAKQELIFYESLLAVAKIYNSMGDLESALIQSGKDLPTEEIIQKTVLECFNHSTK